LATLIKRPILNIAPRTSTTTGSLADLAIHIRKMGITLEAKLLDPQYWHQGIFQHPIFRVLKWRAGATFDWLFFDNSKLINFDC
jgi:hypothetical protein